MEINKRLFEDVLSGKLKGTFVLRNGNKIKSSELEIHPNANVCYYPISLNGIWYTFRGGLHLTKSSDMDIINFISDTNMKENELTIEIPEGKEVDWDESKKQNKIVLKDKQLTYGEVCRKLFGNQDHYLIESNGSIEIAGLYRCACEPNASEDRHQLECILAKNKLTNVAKYVNDGWKPNLKTDWGYVLQLDYANIIIITKMAVKCPHSSGKVVFKSEELAQQAIEILGKETIKFALEPLGI